MLKWSNPDRIGDSMTPDGRIDEYTKPQDNDKTIRSFLIWQMSGLFMIFGAGIAWGFGGILFAAGLFTLLSVINEPPPSQNNGR